MKFLYILISVLQISVVHNDVDVSGIVAFGMKTATIEYTNTKLEVPEDNSFKSYMGYLAITNKSSEQWQLQQEAYTDCNGLRCVDGRFCIATGTYYSSTIGTYIDVYMKNGEILPCILGDVKDDRHTDSTNRQHLIDKSVVEFIVDTKVISDTVKKSGNVENANDIFKGEIDYIIVH